VHLDLAHVAGKGIVTPDAPRSHTADEFRVIKRPLIMNATGKGAAPIRHGNLIMVTSALPGEGKTFTAVNLAMSIATELDHTVLLVDADVRVPRSRLLGCRRRADLDARGRVGGAGSCDAETTWKLPTVERNEAPRATELLASE
jgi:Mrp family chromosome partitioning ATPase